MTKAKFGIEYIEETHETLPGLIAKLQALQDDMEESGIFDTPVVMLDRSTNTISNVRVVFSEIGDEGLDESDDDSTLDISLRDETGEWDKVKRSIYAIYLSDS